VNYVPDGQVTGANVMVDLQTGESLLLGLIKYDLTAAAQMAMIDLNGHWTGDIAPIMTKSLLQSIAQREIWSLFRPFGDIVSMDLVEDPGKGFQRTALISFANTESPTRTWLLSLHSSNKEPRGHCIAQASNVDGAAHVPAEATEQLLTAGDWIGAVFRGK
jgi:hypothetical protein